MKHIKQAYRSTYTGEAVITELNFQGAKWNTTQEFVPNAVTNNQISNQACVIGNGISRKDFDLKLVFNHFGGLLKRYKLQVYGCNAIYRDYTPDFLIVTGDADGIVKEIANSGFCDANVVYADAQHVKDFPGKFYMIPQDPAWNAGAMAAYLAAFDGHTTIYLLGFDGQDTDGYNYNVYAGTNGYQTAEHAQASPKFFELSMLEVFNTYPEVSFVRVMPSKYSTMPESWKYVTNLQQVSYGDFVLMSDL